MESDDGGSMEGVRFKQGAANNPLRGFSQLRSPTYLSRCRSGFLLLGKRQRGETDYSCIPIVYLLISSYS